jgi:molybdenum cofactor synthesis domain-containing protein
MLNKQFKLGIITASDKGSCGEREDKSGALIKEIMSGKGCVTFIYTILPDEQNLLEKELKRLCDEEKVDLLLTTGGTGFSPRDCMPEATSAVLQKIVPGISESLRRHSETITKRAMLSRGLSGIRGNTLIINLPGSPKAVRESLEYLFEDDSLFHGLDILCGRDGECAR